MDQWPKYFIPSSQPRSAQAESPSTPRFALDLFLSTFKVPDAAEDSEPLTEWVVITDSSGHLQLVPGTRRTQLPPDVQHQINTQELLVPKRILKLKSLWLFDIEYIDTRGNPPGLNDPVHLHGRMFGPFPSERPDATGQLTVTRGDILDGLVRAQPFAFRYADGGASGQQCMHLLLPGGTDTDIENGENAVLAFPMLSAALFGGHAGNHGLAAGFLYDILSQLQADFLQENIRGAFPELKLPVPNRRLHESKLRAGGYKVEGDVAYRPAKSSRTWLGRLFQGFSREKEMLPPEGTIGDFLRLARMAAEALPGWPDARAQHLRQKSQFTALSWSIGNDALLRPVAPSIENLAAGFTVTATELVSPAKPANRYICFKMDPAYAFRHNANLDVQVECQGRGDIALTCTSIYDTHEQPSRWTPKVPVDSGDGWQTLRLSLTGAVLKRGWNHADFALGIYSNNEFKIRRVTVTGRGVLSGLQPSVATAAAAPGQSQNIQQPAPKLHLDGKCNLEQLGHWWGGFMPPTPMLFPRTAAYQLRVGGWLIDTKRKSAEGTLFVVLRGMDGEYSFRAEQRLPRGDVVKSFDGVEAYLNSGFQLAFTTDQVPLGEYRVLLRLMSPDGTSGVECDSGRRIRLYDEAPDAPDERPIQIQPLTPCGHHGLPDPAGFDPCFRIGMNSGSGEIAHRVWLKKDRAYLIAVGLMEHELEEKNHRLVDVIVDGKAMYTADLVQPPFGRRHPCTLICPVSRLHEDGWVEIKVARNKASKGPDPNVMIFVLWVFAEGTPIDQESVARGKWTDKALAYWPCGIAQWRMRDEILLRVFPRLQIHAGVTGRTRVARVHLDSAIVVETMHDPPEKCLAAVLLEHEQATPQRFSMYAREVEQCHEFARTLHAAPSYAIVALAVSGSLPKAYAAELRDALRGYGLHIPLPEQSGRSDPQKYFLFIGMKGLVPSYALEMDGSEPLTFPPPKAEKPALIGHWKLNEGEGTKIHDASGRGHHGQMRGCKWITTPPEQRRTPPRPGHVERIPAAEPRAALHFDGSGYVHIPFHKDFELPGDLTLCCWMLPEDLMDRAQLLCGRADPWRPFVIWLYKHVWEFGQCNRHGQGIAYLNYQPRTAAKWHHVAAVVSGTESILFIDGAEVCRRPRIGIPVSSNAPLTIGGFENTWHPHFKGMIQDVRLYNHALSADEIHHVMRELPEEARLVDGPKRSRRKKPSEKK
ncbi:MAG TPA: LamG domain-containing protein [Planctomycetota bacterium]|nr:LamG domain-containing protein [Planctomycetota bacterium]